MIKKLTERVEINKPEYPQFNQFKCYRKDAIKENQAYSTMDLIDDLWTALEYLPRAEVKRIVDMILWFIKEAVRTHGLVSFREFGAFLNSYEGKTPATVYKRHLTSLYIPEYFKIEYPNGGLDRGKLKFSATPTFVCLARPLSKNWFAQLLSRKTDQMSFCRAILEVYKHYRLGKVLFEQKPFNRKLEYEGYTDEFLDFKSLPAGIMSDQFIPNYVILDKAKNQDMIKNNKQLWKIKYKEKVLSEETTK